jgi:hypothetical protein
MNYNRIAPAVAALVEPNRHEARFDVDQVSQPVTIDVAQQQPLRVEAKSAVGQRIGKLDTASHRDP